MPVDSAPCERMSTVLSSLLRAVVVVALLLLCVANAVVAQASPYDWIRDIAHSPPGTKHTLLATTYLIDKQYQLPQGVEVRGVGTAPGHRTIVRAVGAPFTKNCGKNAKNRKGLLLNDDTYVSGLHFVGMETARYDCLTAMIETPGCANSQTQFTTPPDKTACGGNVGGTDGNGVHNATVEDITVEAFTTQNLFFMAPTKAGANVSHDITVRNLRANGTWADGINIHGQHYNVLIEGCTLRYSGDDSFATWSVGAKQTNITFANNRALWPHEFGGPSCAHPTPKPDTTCAPSGCFAVYGGQTTTFLHNEGTGCFKDAVVIYGNVVSGNFGGQWSALTSSTLVKGNKGMNSSCHFNVWPGAPNGQPCKHSMHGCFPGKVVCER